ncbi:MAG TPA: hypothetical protein VGL13_11055 [Polyangiaceae bacterium]
MAFGRLALAAALLVPILHASVGRAEEPPPPATADDAAKTKFAAALKLYNASQYDQALALFRELAGSTSSPNARLYIGLCLEQLGRTIEAYNELARTAKEASLRPESKYDRTREAALAELSVLDARVGKVVVAVLEATPGATVVADGRKLDEREVGVPLVLEPGTHRVEATAPGRPSVIRDVRVEGGETRTVAMSLGAIDAARPSPERTSGTPLVRVFGYGFSGIAVAGFSMFAIGGLWARSKFGSLEDACGGGPCRDPRYQSDVDEGKALQSVANLGLAMGVIGGALGATFLLLGTKDDRAVVAAEPRQGGAAVHYRLRF